jgi:hypothetical protein
VTVNSAAYVECDSRVDCLGAVAGEAGVSVVEIAEIGVLMIGPLRAAILYQFCWAELSAGERLCWCPEGADRQRCIN